MTTFLLTWCAGSLVIAAMCVRYPPRRLRGHLLLTLCTLLCVACALAAGALALALRTYAVFTREEPVATVECTPLHGMPPHFQLHYTPAGHSAPQTFELVGDQWMVSGEILKWHPWLNLVGFRTVHKPTRVSGRFANVALERALQPTAFDLNGGAGWCWSWLHRHDHWLPLVEAVYGNSVYTFANAHRTFTIYITPSGYLVK